MTDAIAPIASLARPAGSIPSLNASPEAASQSGESFAAALGDIVSAANADLKRAEAMAVAGIKGEAETHEVVNALMGAEQSLRMAVAVRDKVVQAYLELSRMQI